MSRLFTRARIPNLPLAGNDYDRNFINRLMDVFRIFFTEINSIQQINISKLNIDTSTIPDQTLLASLRSGDVYMDTSAGNVLKIKP